MPNFAKMRSDEIADYLDRRAAELFTAALPGAAETMPPPLNVPSGTRGNRNANHFAWLAKAEGHKAAEREWQDEIAARRGQ